MPRLLAAAFVALLLPLAAFAQDKKKDQPAPKAEAALSVEKLTELTKPSVVVIHYTGREGKEAGLGSGFVISDDGLIVTNMHVIGDARPISIQMQDGKRHDVVSVHAFDRHLDLAIVKIDAKGLKPLALGDSDKLTVGQAIAAIGHPQGLKYSVVAGVLSGTRDVEGVTMLQIAMPIEQGNSGGPVIDMQGKVVGVVTLKSLVTANLGFAVPVNAVHAMLKKPNTVPMEKWLTLGVLDKSEWKTVHGGRWRQRAGRITADGVGTGFGGRTFALWQHAIPKEPYEISVAVKLDDEAGAAGVIFAGDGGDRHYGFYPTSGKLRFTRFEGPDVYSWKILHDAPSSHYRPGEWNQLRVRIEKGSAQCFVNDQLVHEEKDLKPFGDKAGIAKFRQTVAEYKRFQVGTKLGAARLPEEQIASLKKAVNAYLDDKSTSAEAIERLLPAGDPSMTILREQARKLEKQAAQLKALASRLHVQVVLAELAKEAKKDEKDLDLARSALLLAKLDNEELDVDAYRNEFDRLGRELKQALPKDADDEKKLEALNKFLFEDRGFHGSRHDYYSKANSYLNEVLDDREGLPITLAVAYIEVGRRIGLNLVGVGLPGHFVVRHEPKGETPVMIDVFEGGKFMSEEAAERKVMSMTGKALRNKDLKTVPKKAILVRMLHNLINLADKDSDRDAMLRYLDGILTIDPAQHEERWVRAVLRFQTGLHDDVISDCDYLLDHAEGTATDLDRVRELKRRAETRK
ncbi:MAG: transglutaminase family protein [Gemmataceae bacterium]